MVLKNTGDGEISARPRFRPAAGEGGSVVEPPAVEIKPQEVIEVDLRPLTDAAAGRADLDSVSVQIANTRGAGELSRCTLQLGSHPGADIRRAVA